MGRAGLPSTPGPPHLPPQGYAATQSGQELGAAPLNLTLMDYEGNGYAGQEGFPGWSVSAPASDLGLLDV